MKYLKDIGPQSSTEGLAVLFTMLGNAYNLLAQYEADERKRDEDDRRRIFEERAPKAEPDFSGFSKSHAAHREDEQQ